jgi:hypothetical protein
LAITLEFHATDPNQLVSTLDYLIQILGHDLSMVITSGVETDLLANWCNCRHWKYGYIPLIIWKYCHQAQHYFKIGAFALEKIPIFPISMQDLKPSLICELANLDHEDRSFVTKQAVGHIFENINSRLYHASISKKLVVELVD